MTSRPPRKRLPRLAASLASLALLVTACTPSSDVRQLISTEDLTPAADSARGASWQQENFASFYQQTIDWRDCTAQDAEITQDQLKTAQENGALDLSAFECARVKAPLNWADPSNEQTIELAVTRTKTQADPSQAIPLFTNPGGPGAGGVQHALLLGANPAFEPVLTNHQLWGFDPRGIGNSSPVDCKSDSQLPAVQLAECAADSELANYMGTSQVARDMELLRVLAGDQRMDYLGYSYGTMLGATYATIFPDKAGRMVLDSAENAQWGTLIHQFDQSVAVAKAIVAMADSCSDARTSEGQKVNCPFSSEKELLDLQKKLGEEPLKGSDDQEFGAAELDSYLTSLLYEPAAYQGDGLDLLGKAVKGDKKALDQVLATIADGGASVGTAGQLAACPSTPKTPDVEAFVEHVKQVGVPAYLGGPEISDELLASYTDFSCAVLPATGTDIMTAFDASAVETNLLVIGITGDHATPYQYGKELASELGKATLLTLEGRGHGASYSDRSTCVDDLTTAYLVKGEVPQEGTVCQPNQG